MNNKLIKIMVCILSTLLIALTFGSIGTAQPPYKKIYGGNSIVSHGGFYWDWQLEDKTNEIINNSKFGIMKNRVINKIGINAFYNITYNILFNTFQKTGYACASCCRLATTLYNWILIKSIIRGSLEGGA